MYPSGTLIVQQNDYDSSKPGGVTGSTIHPMYRKVLPEDIAQLKLHKLRFVNNRSIVGEFTNVFHPNHADISSTEFMMPPVVG